MKYGRITVDEKDYQKLFPKYICEELRGKKTYIYGAMRSNDRHLCAAAVFTLNYGTNPEAVLHYVTVEEEYRGRGIGTQLMICAQDSFRAAGVKDIYFSMTTDDAEDLYVPLRFCGAIGFFPAYDMEYLLYYTVDQLERCKGAEVMRKNPERYKKVIEDVERKRREEPDRESVLIRVAGEDNYRAALSIFGEPSMESYGLEMEQKI